MDLREKDIAALQQSILFQDVSIRDIQKLLACLNVHENSYEKGEWILQAGNVINEIGIILEGTAHIERCDYWGSRHIVTSLGPSDVFAESFAASHTVSSVSVQADEKSRAVFLNVSRILTMCASACPFHARIIQNLVSALAARNLSLNEKLTYITQHSLKDKILSYLSAEALRHNSAYFDIPFDRQEMADYLNAERSALSGELSKLKKEGIIDYQKNHFHLMIQPSLQ